MLWGVSIGETLKYKFKIEVASFTAQIKKNKKRKNLEMGQKVMYNNVFCKKFKK